jgi:hypothetical protein
VYQNCPAVCELSPSCPNCLDIGCHQKEAHTYKGKVLPTPITPVEDDLRYCIADEDCIPVSCSCSCSGCGGFFYEDVVNRKYTDIWYKQQGCQPSDKCLMVCCPKRKVSCENNLCVVIEEEKQ